MTTIAYDGKTISADSQAYLDGRKIFLHKLVKTKRFIIAGSGRSDECDALTHFIRNLEKCQYGKDVAEWVNNGMGYKQTQDYNASLLLFDCETDKLYDHSKTLFVEPGLCTGGFFALGSGGGYALAAMHCGKTSREAVEVAKSFDAYTGGDVITYCLETKEELK